jgi:2-polyprenyl-3-methyl-5-hydroxy-6-metoxy-1,4-benzoquinol methylase
MNEQQRQQNAESRAIWDTKAAYWEALHGDSGNLYHRRLVSPGVERLLAVQPGERILDVACGSGVLARRLAELGALVTAVDFSPELVTRAQARAQTAGEPIDYRVVDATDETALSALGAGEFDAVVCTMALMDMTVIEPLHRAVAHLLNSRGRFVVATAHPAFNSNAPVFVSELADNNGEMVTTYSLKISAYRTIPPMKQAGAPGEPAPHYYYHRPLNELLGAAFDSGLVVDGMEEPVFLPEDIDPTQPLSRRSMPQIPPILIYRLRRKA